tara:strand:+ start:80 stop:376 length:297 start_codon:yes stop_codon:yes gene_type:complete
MWEEILKRGSTSKHSIQLIEKVIDSEPRALTEILDKMYDEIENKRKAGGSAAQRKALVPTRNELRFYLSKNYNSALFDKYNDRQLAKKNIRSERRYWK